MRRLFVLSILLFSQASWSDVRLPLHSLRLDGMAHCGPFSMALMLESRTLAHNSYDVTINVEKNLMYWINFERMMYIYRSKKDFYMSVTDESSWQIEFWEVFLKHGREIQSSQLGNPDIWYGDSGIYRRAAPFVAEDRPKPDPTLPPLTDVVARLKQGFASDTDAESYIRNYLDRWFGNPVTTTTWMGQTVASEGLPELLLNDDFAVEHSLDSMVLVKPVKDGKYGWAPYLYDRYQAYLYDASKALDLIRSSLDRGWPVTYDMGPHAETIIGYRWVYNRFLYAVADSLSGTIEWMEPVVLQGELNLLTFAKDAIPGALPPHTKIYAADSSAAPIERPVPPQ